MESQLYYKRSIRVLAKALQQPSQSTDTDATPNDDMTRRSKRLAIQNDSLPDEQVEAQIVDPLHFNNAIPTELFFIIMNWLEVWDQFTMRRVCHSWKAKIESMPTKLTKECLKLNVKRSPMVEPGSRCVRTWEPNESIRRMQFEFVYREPEISEQTQISIWDKAFNSDAARVLGRVFSQVKTLIIFWDSDDSEQNIDNLVLLLSQFSLSFNNLNTFGLIVSGEVTNIETLAKICDAINSHIGHLNQLHLMVPEFVHTTTEQHVENRDFYRNIKLSKVFLLSSFSTTGVINIGSFLKKLCHGQELLNSSPLNLVHPPLESLCFPFNDEGLQANILDALALNENMFVSVKRLVLSDIEISEGVSRLLKYFPNLDKLSLQMRQPTTETFDLAWIRVFKPLAKLADLTMLNFKFERKLLRQDPQNPIDETVNLNQLRKLTVASPYLFFYLREASNQLSGYPLIPQLKPEDIADTVKMRFPGLQELNLWSGDAELHQTGQTTWRALEQSLNRSVPLTLPLLTGLRVNIKLRRPVLHNILLAQPATVQSFYTAAIAKSETHRLNANFAAWNEIIERRQRPENLLIQGIDNCLLVARYYCELTRAAVAGQIQIIAPHEDEEQQQPEGVVNWNPIERILREVIRGLLIQVQEQPDRFEAVGEAIRNIRELIQLRREQDARVVREQEQQAQP